uniref:Uncharacterized protein n=1 Tax=Anopheles darlingi TaxID=43151 RepID=A0A2M4DFG4_ANODA
MYGAVAAAVATSARVFAAHNLTAEREPVFFYVRSFFFFVFGFLRLSLSLSRALSRTTAPLPPALERISMIIDTGTGGRAPPAHPPRG